LDGIEVRLALQCVGQSKGFINHVQGARAGLRFASEPRKIAAGSGVIAFDQEGQVLTRKELILRDQAVVSGPVIADKTLLRFDATYFGKELFEASVVTATQMPGKDFTP
jgi:hypothetical protein